MLSDSFPHDHAAPSVFQPENLLREARRQRGLPAQDVPVICVLDPDGDLVGHLRRHGATPCPGWACYHTELFEFALRDGSTAGIVGCAVGAPFAVLVAEQLFASGCRFLIDITSAGQIADLGEPPYVVLIDSALRDEGTSAHYVAAAPVMQAPDPGLLDAVAGLLLEALPGGVTLHRGMSWTTDAPYRETQAAIDHARSRGALAVEMEAAALYAFATRCHAAVACFALVTNTMGTQDGDFEKGEADGAITALAIVEAAAAGFRSHESGKDA